MKFNVLKQFPVIRLLVVGMVGIAMPAAHAEKILDSDIQFGGVRLINAGESGEEQVDANGVELSGKWKIGWVTPRNSVLFLPMVRVSEFSDERVRDRREVRAQLNWLHHFKTAAVRSVIDYRYEDLFSAEYRDVPTDPDDIPDSDDSGSGVVISDGFRERLDIRQDWNKSIDERNVFLSTVDFRKVAYREAGESIPQVDYDSLSLDIGWRRRLSERTGMTLRFGGERYDGGDEGGETDWIKSQLAFDVDISEFWNYRIAGGYEKYNGDSATGGDGGEYSFALGLDRTSLLSRFSLRAGRYIRPTSAGGTAVETGLSLFFNYRFSEKITLETGFRAFRQERPQARAASNVRDYFRGRIELRRQLSRNWYIEGSYGYSSQQFESGEGLGEPITEDRGKIFLNVRYFEKSQVRSGSGRRFLRKNYE
jgi:hypothetical protein